MSAVETAPVIVAAEWCALLGTSAPNDDDEFFGIGGDSMLALQLVERIEEQLKIAFPLEVLFLDGAFAAVVSASAALVAERGDQA